MRICFCNLTAGFKSGGLETYCWEAGHALAGLGHHVTVMGGVGGAARHEDVDLIALPYTPREKYPNLGSRFRKFMERRSFARQALPRLLAGNYDAVVINKPYDFPLLWQARRQGLKAVTVLRSGGTEFWCGDRFFASAVDRWASSSAYNAKQVEGRYGCPVTVIHNGVDTDRFRPKPDHAMRSTRRAAHGLPAAVTVLVSVGRLVGWKGFSVVIEALAGLPAHIHYLIVGDGEDRFRLEQQAATLNLASRVHFAGAVKHAELPDWLNLADVYVQPSVGEEAFGISVVEGLACGLPALVSDQGGLPEIVCDESLGCRLPPGDVAAWRETIAAFAADPVRLAAAGAAARTRAEAAFTWT
ncbi:glycosyltransferase family 1 protein, partial [bacterium]|nr:glycosyltransferase family 1 protein [bacterium]